MPAVAPPVPGLPPAPPVSFEGATFYGPVKSGETLMGIASQVRPSTSIHLPEMMAILVAGNSEAFANGNPNILRAGSVLKVPTPQALGVQGVPTPSVPDLAVAPPPAESTLTPPLPIAPVAPLPVEPTMQPVAPLPESAPPLATIPPPVVESQPAPLPVPAEPLREIVPQASIPQTERETPPAPSGTAPEAQSAAQPEPPPPVAQPAPIRPPPAVKPPAAQPEESGLSWLANPVVWIAIAMIVLAVAAVVLLPLLRRPAKPKQPLVETEAIDAPKPAPEPSAATATRTQIRETRSVRPRPAVASSPAPTPAPAEQTVSAKPAASKPAATPPKPIDELLKDIDFGLGDAAMSGKGAASAQKLETPRLPDTEPPTASVTRTATNPFLSADLAPAKASTQSQEDLPSELRLDNLDFDFGDLGLENTARPRADLPPLELKPAGSDVKINPPLPAPGASEPVPAALHQVEPLSMPPPSRQFEFTNVTQELEQPSALAEPLELDDDLQGIGSGSLNLGEMESDSESTAGGGGGQETVADYVETKLDLATAYLDMGDQVGARSLLEEALQEGTASQQQQARELLKKLG